MSAVQTTDGFKARTDAKPSAKQVYCLAHLALEAIGVDWPGSRADASQLISRLKDAAPAATPASASADGVPF